MADLHRQLLEDRMSDAALTLLMDEYAEADGIQLLSAFEKSETTMPETLDQATQKKIRKYNRESEKSALLRRTVCRAAKIAAVFVILCSLSVNLILSVEAIRVPCLNFCIRVTDYFTEIQFSDKHSKDTPQNLPFHPPEGYTSMVQTHNYDDFSTIRQDSVLFYGFKHEDGSILSVESFPAEGSISLDTEASESVSFYMNGMKAIHILKNNGNQTIIWFDEHRERIYNAFCSNMDKDDFLTYVMLLSVDLMNDAFYDY